MEFVGAPGNGGPPPEQSAREALIEVTLRQGRVLRTPASIRPEILTALIRATEAA